MQLLDEPVQNMLRLILLSGDGQKLKDIDDLYRLLDKKQIGDTVSFEVYRAGKTMTIPVKLLASTSNSAPSRRVQ